MISATDGAAQDVVAAAADQRVEAADAVVLARLAAALAREVDDDRRGAGRVGELVEAEAAQQAVVAGAAVDAVVLVAALDHVLAVAAEQLRLDAEVAGDRERVVAVAEPGGEAVQAELAAGERAAHACARRPRCTAPPG